MNESTRADRISGALLGCAVGDALGFPYESLGPRRAARLLGDPDRYRFLFGRGMVSDDTEHACLVAQSLVAAGDDVTQFGVELGRRLRWWLAGVPAGVGWATLRSILKLWSGVPPGRSGVSSAGNGPAMRAPLMGLAIDDRKRLREFVSLSTRITHVDPKAEWGALVVALAARAASEGSQMDGIQFVAELRGELKEEASELLDLLEAASTSASRGESSSVFASRIGCRDGVSGYTYQTVPVAIHAWLRHRSDLRSAVTGVIKCGGDTDTTAAIAGAIIGAGVGRSGIPVELLSGLWEWPRSVSWMKRLAVQLAEVVESGERQRPHGVVIPTLLLRNLLFLTVVLVHGFRRLAPPY